MTEQYRKCKKCLIREMYEQQDFFSTLKTLIEKVDPALKTPEELYEKRLLICKECDMLFDGTCKKCGCYVELRAATTKSHCPAKKW